MTNNYQKPALVGPDPIDAATFNLRMGQLDSAKFEYLHGKPLNLLRYTEFAQTTTIDASGAIVASHGSLRVDTFGGDVFDNLETITPGPLFAADRGNLLVITSVSAFRSIVLRHNVGNIYLSGGADIFLNSPEQGILLFYNPTVGYWSDVGIATIPDSPDPLTQWTTLGSESQIDINNISQLYSHLLLYLEFVIPAAGGNGFSIRLNADTGGNYGHTEISYVSSGAPVGSYVNAGTSFQYDARPVDANFRTVAKILIQNYTDSTIMKRVRGIVWDVDRIGTPAPQYIHYGGTWKKSPTAAVTRIQIENSTMAVCGVGTKYRLFGLV